MLIDNLASLSRSTRTTVYTALIIIAAITMYDWIVSPYIICLVASQQYDSVVSKAVDKNKVIAHEVETKTKKLQELNEQLAASKSVLFASGEAKAFFSDLQAIAEEAGCTVNLLNLAVNKPSFRNKQDKQKQTEDISGIMANSATLTVSGQYESILKLVEKVHNHAKKIWMDSFEMEIVNLSSAQLKCDITITLYTIQDKEVAL